MVGILKRGERDGAHLKSRIGINGSFNVGNGGLRVSFLVED